MARLHNLEVEVYSAGSNPVPSVNSLAVKVMAEDGIDISSHYPKFLEEIPFSELDLVITLCGDAKEACPYVPSQRREHWGLPDPAKAEGTEEEKLAVFRKVRDEIKKRVEDLLQRLKK